MDWLIIYLVFAISTSICAWLFYFMPLVKEAKQKNIINTFTNSPVLSSVVYIIISTLIAPTLFVALFSNQHSVKFYEALKQEILKQD